MESFCTDYSAMSKLNCMNRVDAEISQYQVDGASDKAIQLGDVTIYHTISSEIECLFAVAQKSDNKGACNEIIYSHEKFEPSEERNLEYLKSLQDYSLSRYTSS